MDKKVLIIGNRNYSNKRILRELRNLGVKAQITLPKKYVLSTSNESGNDRIFYKDKRVYYSHIDAIIPRIGSDLGFGVSVVRHMNKNNGCYTTSDSEGLINAADKLKCSQILSKSRIRVPSTAYFKTVSNYNFLTDLVGGLPCVAKLVSGSQGKGVFILTDELSGSTALKTILLSQKVILQEYLESSSKEEKKSDIRAWVVGDKVVAAMKRYSAKKDFRSNYSISKQAEIVTLTKSEKEMAINAAKAIGLELCGVDLMRDIPTKKTYVIECNGNASLYGIEKVTGINVAKHIATYVKAKAVNTLPKEEKLLQAKELLEQLKKGIAQPNFNEDHVIGKSFLSDNDESKDAKDDDIELSGSEPLYLTHTRQLLEKSGYPLGHFSSSRLSPVKAAEKWIKENSL